MTAPTPMQLWTLCYFTQIVDYACWQTILYKNLFMSMNTRKGGCIVRCLTDR